jgi:hypothetical protein
MNRTSLATLTLRLAALYFGMQAFLATTMFLVFLVAARHNSQFAFGSIGLIVANLLMAVALWLASRRWADRMLGADGPGPLRAQDVGTLAFRLVGIWLLVSVVRDAGDAVGIVTYQAGWVLAARVSAPVVKLGLGLALILGGAAISRRCFPDGENSSAMPSALQPIAFSVLGLVVLATALPVVVSSLVARGAWYEEDGGMVSSGGSSTPRLVAAILRVAIGLWLFFGFGGLVRFWRWVQTAGVDRPSVSSA